MKGYNSKFKTSDTEINPRDLPPGTRVWVYLRHSPGDNQTIESQESAVRSFCSEKGWVVDRFFCDRWASGKNTENREAFKQMVYLARQKPLPADLLIIWEFSRFARDQIDSQFHRAEFRKNGWFIFSMRDDIPPGSMGKMYESMIDWKNEQFLIDLRANTLRGLHFIAKMGCVPVGRIAPGYKAAEIQIATYKDGKARMGRKPEADPATAPLVLNAFEMKALGAPQEAISKETGLYPPKSGSWNHLFMNRVYIGEYEFHGDVFTNIYPALISKELFDAVQKRLIPKRRAVTASHHHPRRKGSSFFLANNAICAHCGGRMEGKSVNGARYYICARHNEQASNCPEAHLIPADEIEENVLRTLLDHILAEPYLKELLEWTNTCLNNGLEELNLQCAKTRSDYEEAERMAMKMARNFGLMDTPSKAAEKLLREQEALAERLRLDLAALEYEIQYSRIETTPEQIAAFVQRMRAMLDHAEYYDLREVVEQLCSRITLSIDECRLEVHFPVATSLIRIPAINVDA